MLNKEKARPGSEARFDELTAMMARMREENLEPGPETQAEYERVSITCFEVVGAPRVGIDAEATEFFRENVYEPARADALRGEGNEKFRDFWLRSFEECLADHRGRYVMELAREKGGIATVQGMLTRAVDFRGKIVGRSGEIVGEALAEEAYESHTAEECLAYAKKLEEALESWREDAEDIGDPKERDGIVKNLQDAVAWLRFWGERGFGFWAWS